MKRHIKFFHKLSKTCSCPYCGFKTGNEIEFKNQRRIRYFIFIKKTKHIRTNEGITCEQCNFRSIHKYRVNRHVRTVHQKEKGFLCSECPYETSNNSHLDIHVKSVHQKIKDASCNLCEYKTSYRQHPIIHKKQFTKNLKIFYVLNAALKHPSSMH